MKKAESSQLERLRPDETLLGSAEHMPQSALPVGDRGVQLTSTKQKPTTAGVSGGEVEVEIHVCDEVKNLKQDFRCSQKLLVSKMGYFAEVPNGSKLEDMDISVYCDITIFEWLMRWVNQDSLPPENWPKLDAGNVVPIMVSCAFLKMEPLLQDCLAFCHDNMNDIIKTSDDLSCLNDSILTRLAALFSNSDVEALRDMKDNIKGRIFCKLITSLSESSLEPTRGHFSSLAGVYRCGECHKLVLSHLKTNILCKPSNMKMDRYGNIRARHTRDLSDHIRSYYEQLKSWRTIYWRDPNWNLSDHIRSYYEQLKSWRAVYWRLWGDCHFMFCGSCHAYFPLSQTKWCPYHPQPPHMGRHPCCGALTNQSGCQYREHVPVPVIDGDSSSLGVYRLYEDAIAVDPPQVMHISRREMVPTQNDNEEEESGSSESSESENWPELSFVKSELLEHHSTHSGQWSSILSIRKNQDNQREYEEQAMRELVELLTRRTCGVSTNQSEVQHSIWNNHITPRGGAYVRMEQEWKEEHKSQSRQRSTTNSSSARPKLPGNR